MHFGENQLSRCLIGLSPLSTGHPPSFQPRWVRPSTRSYPRFSLPMDRSHRFGSRTSDSTPCSDSLSLRLPVVRLTSPLIADSPAHSSKGTPSQAPRDPLRRLVGTRFQVLFHSPPGVLFTFPSRYLSAIGHWRVFSLTGWSPQIRTEFLGYRTTWEQQQEARRISRTGLLPSVAGLSMPVPLSARFVTPRGPGRALRCVPRPPHGNACRLCHHTGLGCAPFARHYWGHHYCFLFLRVLRCFTSPGSLPCPMCSGRGDTA